MDKTTPKPVTTAEARALLTGNFVNRYEEEAAALRSVTDQLDAANADNESRQRINRKDQETIEQLRADLARRSAFTPDEINKALMHWINDNMNLKTQLAAVTKERDHWKANHDNQVAIKHAVLDRPDLGDQSRSVLALTTQIKTLQSLLDAARQAGAQAQREADSLRSVLVALTKKPVTTDLAEPTFAVRDVLAERQRQMESEGWTAAHDDHWHRGGELAIAASCYAYCASDHVFHTVQQLVTNGAPKHWPWDERWWKPKSRRYDLVRAGALILAEIERLDRKAQST